MTLPVAAFPGRWSDPFQMGDLDRLLADGNLDGLLRLVDEACAACDWNAVEGVATRSRAAIERGHQLWPAADHAEHRLALQAPAQMAAAAVLRDAPTFGVAPLAEVAASRLTWADLEPHLPVDAGALRAIVAHERIARGEDLTSVKLVDDPLGLPLRLATWEPATNGPDIGPYGVDDPVPPAGVLEPLSVTGSSQAIGPETDAARLALRELAASWTEQSEGTAVTTAITGSGPEAVAALAEGEVQLRRLTADEGFGLLAWLGASAGANGRRRGAARGRFEAWWCATALAGLEDAGSGDSDWPPEADELGEAIAELGWWRWEDNESPAGRFLGLAVDDPLDGIAWALAALERVG